MKAGQNELNSNREFNAHSSDANITVEYDDGRIVSLKYLALDTENPKKNSCFEHLMVQVRSVVIFLA